MITPLQTLIDWITDEVHPSQIKEQAELLLKFEKEQIIAAWLKGRQSYIIPTDTTFKEDAEE